MMITEITKGIQVTVQVEFQPEYSNPVQNHFVFTYQITIENKSDKTIQLISRHWEIDDVTFPKREVDGEGVVGKQPVLEPGQAHHYVSGCNLKSGIGKMQGYYIMEQLVNGRQFPVNIPSFDMIVPFKLN